MRGGCAGAGHRTTGGDLGRFFGRAGQHLETDLDAPLKGGRLLQLPDDFRCFVEHQILS
jgi:hypothetical protein